MEGQGGAGLVGVEVEEGVVLDADEVVGGGWATAVVMLVLIMRNRGMDMPCYAYRLGQLERCFECFPVGWRNSVDSKPDTHEDESWTEAACLCCGDLVDFVLVDIWAICVNVYTETRFLVLVRESSEVLSALSPKSTKARKKLHTVYIVLLPKDQTIRLGAFRKLKLHAQRIDVRKMVLSDRLQIAIGAYALPLLSRLFSNLSLISILACSVFWPSYLFQAGSLTAHWRVSFVRIVSCIPNQYPT